MDHLTSLSLGQVEVGQLIIPVGTIGPVYVKVGDGIYIPGDQFRLMASGKDISSIAKRREFIGKTSFDSVLSKQGLGHQAFFALTDEEVHLLYVDCKRLKGNAHVDSVHPGNRAH